MGITFLKGHGTQNDFVLLPDPDATLDLTEERVRALCDRQRGLGADGVLRVVRTAALVTGEADVPGMVGSASDWFMDYRNADGSIAEMCGNGVRVFARYLVDAGLVDASEFVVGSRAGDKPVVVHADGSVTVSMGKAVVTGTSEATLAGSRYAGIAVDVGNPHLVTTLDTDIAELDLTRQPDVDPADFPHGVNVEFLNRLADDVLRMRVFERGVGETRSCGTGTVAAVAADLYAEGEDIGTRIVRIPGGEVTVRIQAGDATLTGPAVILAEGMLNDNWWSDPA
ncbi:diaminopimelate epimerase [Haloechinothrix salitolerans]|uniref:Diaminopimelate epimerase n=1 Tax=Haloechinothrix salitolerans TaxID=926830 RepID=A0ABW2C339_9PSEU